MKLIRFGTIGKEQPGLELINGSRISVSGFTKDYDPSFFEDDGLKKLESWLPANLPNCPTVTKKARLGCPISNPSKIICVGLNYKEHAKESGLDIPDEPVLFFKSTSAISGPFDHVMLPKNGKKTDWEVELAVVLGKKCSHVEQADAMGFVAGFLLHNDISERSFQLERSGQWVKGKSCDTFAPLGPYLVTPDEIEDPNTLGLSLKLNGQMIQKGNTSDMIFQIPFLISYISKFMTLLPGDVISTGTPHGVGLGFDPPIYLKAGDEMELHIDNLGCSRQIVVPFQ